MEGSKARLLDVEGLSTELQQLKAQWEAALEHNLNKIEANKSWSWVDKQKASTTLKQAYEDSWLRRLNDAGIVVSPVFESVKEETLYEEFKAYETLWD